MSSSSTTLPAASEILALALAGQENQVPAAEEQVQEQAHGFLTLAPTTSASYPKPAVVKAEDPKPVGEEETLAIPTPTPAVPGEQKLRRSSSLSSDGSISQKKRFLRLGPVHFGIGEGDWSEEVVE